MTGFALILLFHGHVWFSFPMPELRACEGNGTALAKHLDPAIGVECIDLTTQVSKMIKPAISGESIDEAPPPPLAH